MDKIKVLKDISFGARIAEDESKELKKYFISTSIWESVYDGRVDVIYGAKGSGKSAIYSILELEADSLMKKHILVKSAENPRGNPVFQDLVASPPIGEKEFIKLWKLYFLVIANAALVDDCKITDSNIKKIKATLEKADLIPASKGLKAILRACVDYLKRGKPEMTVSDGSSISFGVTFREPNASEKKAGVLSVDNLYELLNESLMENNISLWILIDRLDVAFSENLELETNALKALFKVYNDLKSYDNIQLKIFLRDDIWRRITKEGFREASHITKTSTIAWTSETLLHLLISRLLNNETLVQEYDLDKEKILNSIDEQETLFYTIFPDQVDQGSKKPKTFDWITSRIRDGLGVVAPRELIHLLNEAIEKQLHLSSIGKDNTVGKKLFSSSAIKDALNIVSKIRLEQTIYAEFPTLKDYIRQLEEEKAEHTIDTLANIWGIDLQKASSIINELTEIGFFEKKGSKQSPRFKIPFIYRSALNIVQGSAD